MKPILAVVTRGRSNTRFGMFGARYAAHWQPGTIVLWDAGFKLDDVEFDAPFEELMVELEFAKYEKWTGNSFSLQRPHIMTEDPIALALVQAMQADVLQGCPSGRVFAESISLSLMSYISGRYAVPGKPDRRCRNGLSTPKLRRLQDYILAHLSSDLSLDELASLVDLSPPHLCRSFKAATGLSPHQYILQARIEWAKALLLANDKLSIVEIALTVGFADQSHFSHTFRKHTGMSPRQFTRQ